MTVTLEQFKKNPGVPPGIAASRLGISRQRVDQLLGSGKLEALVLDGERFVSVASILARQRRLQQRKQSGASQVDNLSPSQVSKRGNF